MNEHLTFLGLARRAGKLAAGEDAVDTALSQGVVRLIVLAADAGEHTVRRMEHRSQARLPILYLKSEKEALGQALGWKSCAVAALTDLGMAESYAKKMADAFPEHRSVYEALVEKREKIHTRRQKKPGKRTRQQ